MDLRGALRKIFTLPPHVTAAKVWKKIRVAVEEFRNDRNLRSKPTYHLGVLSPGEVEVFFPAPGPDALRPSALPLREKCEHLFRHEFDLLGSGLVRVAHGMQAAGCCGRRFPPEPKASPDKGGLWINRVSSPNRAEARRRWSLVEAPYEPVDWQLDIKSGFRWDEGTPSRKLSYGREPGVDVKVPWELGRMQHLPILAYGYCLAASGKKGFRSPAEYSREFRNQVLDFTAHNPPRWGVQWACTMDVAIRAANWTAAYGLFLSQGASFDAPFREVFRRALREHVHFILHHLEWDPHLRANHYLADVAGLLFAAAALPSSATSDAALAFAVQELVSETRHQFHPDGSNFEASTSYHRLSAETVLWATAFTLGLPESRARALVRYDSRLFRQKPGLKNGPQLFFNRPGGGGISPFDLDHFRLLEGMGRVVVRLSHPDGFMPQFGDNDSGRFLALEADETEALDHRPFLAALNGLFDRADWRDVTGPDKVEEGLVRNLARGPAGRLPEGSASMMDPGTRMGVHVLSNPSFHVVMRCGEAGQRGNGGHAHADLLGFEMSVKKTRFVVDPGTYLYTASLEERNAFRSVRAHNGFHLEGREPLKWRDGPEGLFSILHWPSHGVTAGGARRLAARHEGYGAPVHRMLVLNAGSLAGEDHIPLQGTKVLRFCLHPDVKVRPGHTPREWLLERGPVRLTFLCSEAGWLVEPGRYSPAYGRVDPSVWFALRTEAEKVDWSFVL